MHRFSPLMSTVVAAATVNGMEAIANCIKAYERTGADRLECLREARDDLDQWFADIDAAIAAESLALASAAE